MAARKIVIEFLGDSKDLQNAMGDAESKSSKLSGTLGKVGKAAAVGLGAGIAAAAVGLVKLTKGAAEDEQAQIRLATAYRNNANATDAQIAASERWISAQGRALGVTDDDRPGVADARGDECCALRPRHGDDRVGALQPRGGEAEGGEQVGALVDAVLDQVGDHLGVGV